MNTFFIDNVSMQYAYLFSNMNGNCLVTESCDHNLRWMDELAIHFKQKEWKMLYSVSVCLQLHWLFIA